MTTNLDESGNEDVKVFVSDSGGPDGYVGFFEDDGTTGYLYVSDRNRKEIICHLQIYINSADLHVSENDVQVVWSKDGKKCGVRIWGGMRGIIDVERGQEGRVFVDSRETPAISDSEWLSGFEGVL